MRAWTSATCAGTPCRIRRLEVESEQRLGVRRPQVEPPVAEVDGEAVEAVLGVGGVGRGHPLDHRGRDRRPCVLISPDAA